MAQDIFPFIKNGNDCVTVPNLGILMSMSHQSEEQIGRPQAHKISILPTFPDTILQQAYSCYRQNHVFPPISDA